MKPFLRTLLDTDHPLGDLLAVAFIALCVIIALHL